MKQQFCHDPLLWFVESRRAWQSRGCYRPHTHPTLSIGAIDKGVSFLQVDERRDQLLEAGDVVVIPANRVHSCNPSPDNEWSYQMLYLDTNWVARLRNESLADMSHLRPAAPTHLRAQKTYRRFCRLNNLLFEKVPAQLKEEALIGFVGDLLLNPAPEPDTVPRWVEERTEHLRLHCEENWSIADLAERAAVSRYHLIRVFKQNTGMSPHAFQIDCRINKARHLLRKGEHLADLALQLGFNDQSHFQRAFRQRTSMTPGDYQRQLRR